MIVHIGHCLQTWDYLKLDGDFEQDFNKLRMSLGEELRWQVHEQAVSLPLVGDVCFISTPSATVAYRWLEKAQSYKFGEENRGCSDWQDGDWSAGQSKARPLE